MSDDTLPLYSVDLLEHLQEQFGNYEPRPGHDTPDAMWFKTGQKALVQYIQQLKDNAEEDILNVHL